LHNVSSDEADRCPKRKGIIVLQPLGCRIYQGHINQSIRTIITAFPSKIKLSPQELPKRNIQQQGLTYASLLSKSVIGELSRSLVVLSAAPITINNDPSRSRPKVAPRLRRMERAT
jgi:hypothetical protein